MRAGARVRFALVLLYNGRGCKKETKGKTALRFYLGRNLQRDAITRIDLMLPLSSRAVSVSRRLRSFEWPPLRFYKLEKDASTGLNNNLNLGHTLDLSSPRVSRDVAGFRRRDLLFSGELIHPRHETSRSAQAVEEQRGVKSP